MIDPQTARSDSTRRLWAGHVQRVFETLHLNDRGEAVEISEGLAAFCEQHPHVTQQTLSLLMARSFCATGNCDAAVCVLQADHTHCRYAEPWVEALSAKYPFPELYPLFNTRVLRPLRLATAGSRAVWVLDLGKVHLSEADRHEMILLKTLRTLTEKVSNVWEKADGQGTLVIKGLSRLTNLVQLSSAEMRPSQITGYLQNVLRRRSERSGWGSVPSILLLDL
jgi:hypothetical protein